MTAGWRERARDLGNEVLALYLACKDPRVPWAARVLAIIVVAYALSPIDLIPDPIPVLGQMDDLILVPLGVLVVRRLVPADVLAECRERVRTELAGEKPASRTAAMVIIAVWLAAAAFVIWMSLRWVGIAH